MSMLFKHNSLVENSHVKQNQLNFVGLDKIDDTVRFKCHDSDCEFHEEPLPIYVIDEDIYEKQPSILIGTEINMLK